MTLLPVIHYLIRAYLFEGEYNKRSVADPVRPQGGAGRGKDMANIIEAQRKKSDASAEASPGGAGVGKPPAKPAAKSHRKLTDLDMDDVTESDTDEYQASEYVLSLFLHLFLV